MGRKVCVQACLTESQREINRAAKLCQHICKSLKTGDIEFLTFERMKPLEANS